MIAQNCYVMNRSVNMNNLLYVNNNSDDDPEKYKPFVSTFLGLYLQKGPLCSRVTAC